MDKNAPKMRLMRFIGEGDMYQGYLKYQEILEKHAKQFLTLCKELEESPLQYIGFERFIDYAVDRHRLVSMKNSIGRNGITRYSQLTNVHQILKYFKKFKEVKRRSTSYIKHQDRQPLTEYFIKKYYWKEKLTTETIAYELLVPEIWVQKEITRLGLKKKENGIKLRGRRGYKMPEHEKVKHRRQPHARAVVQLCPVSFKILRTYNATGAVERDGWSRENVRKAIKSAGLHDGFLWAYQGEEENIIQKAKAKGDLAKKLRIWKNGEITKEDLQRLYIDQNLTTHQVAKILGCHHSTVAGKAMRFGLSKKKKPLSKAELKDLYIVRGLQAHEIAAQTGRTTKTITTYLSRMKIHKYKGQIA